MRLEDYDAIRALCQRNGLTIDQRSQWNQRSVENPFHGDGDEPPVGWVLEDPVGQVVGVLRNIPLVYVWNGRQLRAFAASCWAVDAHCRGSSIMLLHQFFRQESADLFINTTATAEAGRVFAAFHAKPIPVPAYQEVLFWITDYDGFTRSVLRRKRAWAASTLRRVVSWGLGINDWWQGRGKVTTGREGVQRLNEFDERFDEFWMRMVHRRRDRLLAVRHRAALRWQFGPAIQNNDAYVFAFERGRRLAGYMVLVRRDRTDIGLRRFQIADLQIDEDRVEFVHALLATAVQVARAEGAHTVEVMGLDRFKQQALRQLSAYRRRLPTFPFLYKMQVPEIDRQTDRAEAWDPCLYDGDACW